MPRRRTLPADLRAPREAIARLVMEHVSITNERSRGQVTVKHEEPRTVVLSWRSTGCSPAGRTTRSTIHQRTVFEKNSLVLDHNNIRSQAGQYVGIINAGPDYQQKMTDLREALELQLYEQTVLREVLGKAAKPDPRITDPTPTPTGPARLRPRL